MLTSHYIPLLLWKISMDMSCIDHIWTTFLCGQWWPLTVSKTNANWQHQQHEHLEHIYKCDLVREGCHNTFVQYRYTAFSTKLTSPTATPAPPTRAASAAAPLAQARCREPPSVCPRRLSSSAAASGRGRCTPGSPRRRPPARCPCAPSATGPRACCSSCLSDVQKPVVKGTSEMQWWTMWGANFRAWLQQNPYPAAHGFVIIRFRRPPGYDLYHKGAESIDVALEIWRTLTAAAAVLLSSLCFGGEFVPYANICNLHQLNTLQYASSSNHLWKSFIISSSKTSMLAGLTEVSEN